MASAVTTPLERQFGQMPSLTQMTSVSSFGYSQITLQFDLDRSIDAASRTCRRRSTRPRACSRRSCPRRRRTRRATRPISPSSRSPSAPTSCRSTRSTTSPTRSSRRRSPRYPGVGLVTINGGQKPAVRVQVDPEALAGTGLTLEDVRQALAAANVNQPKGNIDGPRQDYTLATNDQLFKAEGFKPLVIAYANGSPVRLQDVATAVDGVENAQLAGLGQRQARHHPQRAAPAGRERHPGRRSRQGAAASAAGVAAAGHRRQRPERSHRDGARLGDDVERTLVITVGLVVAVIFAFLRNVRATIIPSIAVPLSLIGTFGGDVPGRLQSEQPVAHGAHHRDGLRRRRRDRDDREHRAVHRGGRDAASRPPSKARGRSGSRSSR